jgi:hypothetical protein
VTALAHFSAKHARYWVSASNTAFRRDIRSTAPCAGLQQAQRVEFLWSRRRCRHSASRSRILCIFDMRSAAGPAAATEKHRGSLASSAAWRDDAALLTWLASLQLRR